MWENIKYYAIAYALLVVGALASTGLQLLESQFPEIHPLSKLAANLSGITLGSVIMIVGLIRDSRLDNERKRTAEAQEEAVKEGKRADQERQRADTAESVIQQERQRADRAEAELARVRAEYEAVVLARIRRLEEFAGITPPESESEPD